MSNPIVKALEHGAQKLGKTLGEDAGKAVKDLYHSTGKNLKKVADNTVEADTKHAEEFDRIHRREPSQDELRGNWETSLSPSWVTRGRSNGSPRRAQPI